MNKMLTKDRPLSHFPQEGEQRALPSLTGIPVQAAPAHRAGPPRRSVRLQYASPEQKHAVIQRKQIIPLRDRLVEFNADVTQQLSQLNDKIAIYDDLDNTGGTKVLQEILLREMLDLLEPQTDEKMKRAFKVIQDELSFVLKQDFTHIAAREDPWAHMDDAPFFRELKNRAVEQGILTTAPPEMNAHELVTALSEAHIHNLVTQRNNLERQRQDSETQRPESALRLPDWPAEQQDQASRPVDLNTFHIADKVLSLLNAEGELVHYTHFKDLTIIHSTDYLKQNSILHSDEQNQTPGEGTYTTKNQDIDFHIIKNTGFVFMFLEHKDDARPNTRFGKYRMSLPVSSPEAARSLKGGWAIMHDLTNVPKPDRPIYPGSKMDRITSIRTGDTSIGSAEKALSQSFLEQSTLFAPHNRLQDRPQDRPHEFFQKLVDETPQKIEDKLSGNFLAGSQILPGVALRVECELRLLAQVAPEEALQVLSSKEMLWKYIKNVIFNMQIMVPNSVMPEEMRVVEQAPAASAAPAAPAAPAPQKKSQEELFAERAEKNAALAKKRAEAAKKARAARKAKQSQKGPESAEKPEA